jgi:PAS domain S-box-containing protein
MAISRGGTIELINPSAQALIGWNQGDALGLSWQSVLKLATSDGKDVSEADNPIAQALQNNKPTHSDVLSLRTSSDKLRLVSIASSPVGQSGEGVIVIFRDITKEKAEEREQAEFISTASHEMRTPVASIEGYLGLALNPATANIDEKARDFITKAHESAQHLGRLFQDLLDISKAEDGRLKNEPHVIDVVAYVADIFEGLKPKATEKGLRYFYKPNPSLEQTDTERKLSPVYYADVDPDHFREITANLIENAIKYTLEGEVIVDVTGDDQTVTVSVRDSGIGIPTEDIPHLFQKFYRVDNTDTREIGGTGLGLYLSRRLAEAMSGNLRVESEYKKGSTFFLDIPRMSHEGALEKMRQVSDVTDAPEQMAPPAPTPPVQPPAPSAQPATPNVATAPTPQSQTPSVTPISQPTQPAATARAHISVPDRSGFIKKP